MEGMGAERVAEEFLMLLAEMGIEGERKSMLLALPMEQKLNMIKAQKRTVQANVSELVQKVIAAKRPFRGTYTIVEIDRCVEVLNQTRFAFSTLTEKNVQEIAEKRLGEEVWEVVRMLLPSGWPEKSQTYISLHESKQNKPIFKILEPAVRLLKCMCKSPSMVAYIKKKPQFFSSLVSVFPSQYIGISEIILDLAIKTIDTHMHVLLKHLLEAKDRPEHVSCVPLCALRLRHIVDEVYYNLSLGNITPEFAALFVGFLECFYNESPLVGIMLDSMLRFCEISRVLSRIKQRSPEVRGAVDRLVEKQEKCREMASKIDVRHLHTKDTPQETKSDIDSIVNIVSVLYRINSSRVYDVLLYIRGCVLEEASQKNKDRTKIEEERSIRVEETKQIQNKCVCGGVKPSSYVSPQIGPGSPGMPGEPEFAPPKTQRIRVSEGKEAEREGARMLDTPHVIEASYKTPSGSASVEEPSVQKKMHDESENLKKASEICKKTETIAEGLKKTITELETKITGLEKQMQNLSIKTVPTEENAVNKERTPQVAPKEAPGSIKKAVPGVPSVPRAPGAPSVPRAPGVPSVPRAPGVPGIPQPPGVPRAPGIPQPPGVPRAPGMPKPPGVPGVPGAPGVPGMGNNGPRAQYITQAVKLHPKNAQRVSFDIHIRKPQEDSIWSKLDKEDLGIFEETDFSEFARSKTPGVSDAPPREYTEEVGVFSKKRCKAIDIVLARVKIPLKDLVRCADQLDVSPFSEILLRGLLSNYPTDEELALVKEHAVKLVPEIFYKYTLDVPRFRDKLVVLQMQLNISAIEDTLVVNIERLSSAGKVFLRSSGVQRVFRVTLDALNILSAGTRNEGAWGVKISALPRILEDKKIVGLLQKKIKTLDLKIDIDITKLKEALLVSPDVIEMEHREYLEKAKSLNIPNLDAAQKAAVDPIFRALDALDTAYREWKSTLQDLQRLFSEKEVTGTHLHTLARFVVAVTSTAPVSAK